jgi:hypothetical protein
VISSITVVASQIHNIPLSFVFWTFFPSRFVLMQISDEYVKRQLIDQNHIESTILIANRKEADEIMYSQPRNVTSCFALNPDRKGFGYRITGKYVRALILPNNSNGGSGIAPVYPWKNTPRLTTRSIDEQIKCGFI